VTGAVAATTVVAAVVAVAVAARDMMVGHWADLWQSLSFLWSGPNIASNIALKYQPNIA
jgi:hypothetical protein